MDRIIKIYDRLTLKHIKIRTLLVFIIIQNVFIALVVLIFSNIIVTNANVIGEIDYNQIRILYFVSIILLFSLIYIEIPYFLSSELNEMYKNNIIEHLLSVKIDISDIVVATYLRGLSLAFILFMSSIPIICVSLHFGGVGIIDLFKLFFILLSYMLLISTISIYISTRVLNGIASRTISYIICLIALFLYILFLNRFLRANYALLFFTIISIFISLILLTLSRKTTIFSL